MSPITTHILDTARGRPATGVTVILEQAGAGQAWTELARGTTDVDGRVRDLLPDDARLDGGVYRLRFQTGAYFRTLGVKGFYPEVQVVIELEPGGGHYHIPLLLSPFGYSTYRGS
jgi:5-hydroxyisourate hydrolase